MSYREAGVWIIDVAIISWTSRGEAATVTSQNVLTGSLKVKGPAVEGVVVGVAKHSTYTWLCRKTQTEEAFKYVAKIDHKKQKLAK